MIILNVLDTCLKQRRWVETILCLVTTDNTLTMSCVFNNCLILYRVSLFIVYDLPLPVFS